MPGTSWGDDDLRRYVLRSGDLFWLGPEQAEDARAPFRRAVARIVPGVQRRLLEEVGATSSRSGVGLLAVQLIESSNDPRKFWLVLSTTPWEYLEEVDRRVPPRGEGEEEGSGGQEDAQGDRGGIQPS